VEKFAHQAPWYKARPPDVLTRTNTAQAAQLLASDADMCIVEWFGVPRILPPSNLKTGGPASASLKERPKRKES